MSRRRMGVIALPVGVLLGAIAVGYAQNLFGPSPSTLDPAVEFHTRDHYAGYAGIDRWAYYGMREESLVDQLKREGYACEPPRSREYSGRPFGIGQLVCTQRMNWPIPRTLSIEASIDYDRRGRLVAALATSVSSFEPDSILGRIERGLREIGWIEPARMAVRGFEIDSANLLARLVADLLTTGGWESLCDQTDTPMVCGSEARRRRAAGYSPLPDTPLAVPESMRVQGAMARAYLLPPVDRGADGKPDDSLLVRVEGERMWLDFVGKDLTGRTLAVAIELDSEGGKPLQLIARAGEGVAVVPLAGAVRRANDGRTGYLVPEAGEQNPRTARWFYPPRKEASANNFANFAKHLANVDPAFAPKLIGALVASLAAPLRPDERLGLYPALASIERLADDLRASGADRWMRDHARTDLIAAAHRSDPVIRAAWALALCEHGKPPALDRSCWAERVRGDDELRTLLQQEVDRLDETYASLDAAHPIRRRLAYLRDVLAHGSEGV